MYARGANLCQKVCRDLLILTVGLDPILVTKFYYIQAPIVRARQGCCDCCMTALHLSNRAQGFSQYRMQVHIPPTCARLAGPHLSYKDARIQQQASRLLFQLLAVTLKVPAALLLTISAAITDMHAHAAQLSTHARTTLRLPALSQHRSFVHPQRSEP